MNSSARGRIPWRCVLRPGCRSPLDCFTSSRRGQRNTAVPSTPSLHSRPEASGSDLYASGIVRVLSVVGNRPQFVKSAPLSVALREAEVEEVVVHTGQHYDRELSGVFFEELGLAEPAY